MLLSRLDIRLVRLVFWFALFVVTVLALIPAQAVPVSSGWDKIDHWLAFFVLSALADRAYPKQLFWRRIALGLFAYGVAIELAQSLTPDRQAELMDLVADSIGIAIYALLRRLAVYFPGAKGVD